MNPHPPIRTAQCEGPFPTTASLTARRPDDSMKTVSGIVRFGAILEGVSGTRTGFDQSFAHVCETSDFEES